MSEAFRKLCSDVGNDTAQILLVSDCYPHYQRVLDYIIAHPDERDEMAAALAGGFYARPDAASASVYLLQFLMKTLKWPEVKAAAEERLNDGGNHFEDHELMDLLQSYEKA